MLVTKDKIENWIEVPKLASRISGGTGELEASRPFVCTKCGKKFSQPSNLKHHHSRIHSGEK